MFAKVLIVILIVLVVAMVVLYFIGKKNAEKAGGAEAQIEAAKQTVTMLIIDKKKLKLKESGLPCRCPGTDPQVYAPCKISHCKGQRSVRRYCP